MGTHSQTQSVLSNIIIVSNQMLVVLVNYWCPKGQMSIWQFLRRNWVPWWLSSKESACDARAAVDTDPMDCSPPDPSVHGTSQAGILEGLAMSSSRDFPDTWIEHRSPALQAHSLPTEPPGKPLTTLPSIGEGNGNPLQCSCLENPMDKGARQATTINNNWFKKWALETVRAWDF